MKKFLFFVMIAMTMVISSCSQTEMSEWTASNKSTSSIQHEGTRSLASDEEMLQFDNEADFQAAVAQLKNLSTVEEKTSWVRNNFGDFKSIQDLYWDAMNEVDESNDDSTESFELFQQKYEGLYFPKYMEDMGFYIPMTDLDKACLVNRNCEVSIAGSIQNLRDIYDYSTLMMLDRAYYAMEKPMAIGTVYNFTLDSTSMNSVGPEYDSDWKYFNNTTDGTERKVKLKARRRFVTIPISSISNGSQSRVHLELCFRKKRWCGYTNYKAQTTMTFNKIVIPGYGNLGPFVYDHEESYSSHDDEFPYPIKITHDNNHCYYTFEEIPFNVTVNVNKIKDPIIFAWNMYALQAVTPPTGYEAPIFPNY